MTPAAFAAYLDATNLKLDATEPEIRTLCLEAIEEAYFSVMLYPAALPLARSILEGSAVKLGTVAGFPSGCSCLASKRAELVDAAILGAHEIDVVAPHFALRAGRHEVVEGELKVLAKVARDANLTLKVIVETCYLDETMKGVALRICEDAGVDFIKTSTGFGSAGAQVADIQRWKSEKRGNLRIKASGGIRNLEAALALIHAGADRLGVSAAGKLMQSLRDGLCATPDPLV
jgi:deoxyribose-phosphate aldolase